MRRSWGLAALFLAIAVVAANTAAVAAERLTANGEKVANERGLPTATTPEIRLANSAAGEMYADMLGASINAQRTFRSALPSIFSYSQTAHYQNRADAGGYADGALANFAPESYYVYCPTTMCSPGSKWVMWDVPFFTKETHKADGGYLGYEQNLSGFATGISYMIGESSAIGFAGGYDRRKLKGRDGYLMENKGDTMHLALYGGTNIGHWFIDGYAGFSRSWNETKRGFETGTGSKVIYNGKPHDNVYSAGLKASYVWILGNDMRITPSIGVDFSHVRMGGTTEGGVLGNDDALRIDKSSYTSVAMPLMVSANKTFASCFLAFGGYESLWTPEVRAGFVPQFGSKRADVDATFVGVGGTPGINVQSTRFNKSYGTVGTGLKIKLRDKYIFGVDYDYSFASKWNHHSLTAMYGVSF